MTFARPPYGLLLVLASAAGSSALSQTTLHGTVRNASGQPAAGSTVRFVCDASPSRSVQTTAAADGSYTLSALAPCTYRATAQLQELASTPTPLLVESKIAARMQLDFTLGAASPTATGAPPRPTFAASGIRGLIDPGGYSAPANAAAASGLLIGMADANRTARPVAGDCAVQALPALQTAHDARPQDAAATIELAEALVIARRFDEARALMSSLPQAYASDTADPRVLRLLARIDEGTGAFEDAAREYHRLDAAEPSAQNRFAEGYELILAGQPSMAAAVYRDGLQLYPHSLTLLLGTGLTEFFEGHTAPAIALLLQAAEADPGDPRPYPMLAATSGVSGAEANRAIAATERHLTLTPRDAHAHLALALELLHSPARPGVQSEVEQQLRLALGIDPSLAEAHSQLATLLSARGATDEAMRELQLTVQLDPDREEAHYRLSLALRKAGQNEAAAHEMQLFQQARAQDHANGSDPRRYLSVMKPVSSRPLDCPAQ